MCLVSVILPVYNAEKYLEEAIESILNQSFDDFELIIIDDGSTDLSASIIQSYQDQRIVFISNHQNKRLIETLNIGLSRAKGKYIARMDADDISLPDRLSKQVEFLENNIDYVLVGTNYQTFGFSSEVSDLPITDEEIKLELFFKCPLAHPTVMIRNEVIQKKQIYYPAEFLHMEDIALWFKLMNEGKFANLRDVLLKYRIDGQNISVKNLDTHQRRYDIFYKTILTAQLGHIEDKEMACHYILSIGRKMELPSVKCLFNYQRRLRQTLYSKHDRKLVDSNIERKLDKLFYVYSDKSIRLSILFIFRFCKFDLTSFRYMVSKINFK